MPDKRLAARHRRRRSHPSNPFPSPSLKPLQAQSSTRIPTKPQLRIPKLAKRLEIPPEKTKQKLNPAEFSNLERPQSSRESIGTLADPLNLANNGRRRRGGTSSEKCGEETAQGAAPVNRRREQAPPSPSTPSSPSIAPPLTAAGCQAFLRRGLGPVRWWRWRWWWRRWWGVLNRVVGWKWDRNHFTRVGFSPWL